MFSYAPTTAQCAIYCNIILILILQVTVVPALPLASSCP